MSLRAVCALSVLALAGWAALGAQPAAAGDVSPLPPSDYGVRPVCAAPAPGHAGCLSLELVPETPAARAHSHPLGMTRRLPSKDGSSAEPCQVPTPANGCYGLRPQDFRSAYQLPGSAPTGQAIAVVDPYNNLEAESDLEKYDQEFGLSACTTENGCFEKVNEHGETGKPPYPATAAERKAAEVVCEKNPTSKICQQVHEAPEWAIESDLDIEIAHAICQNCHILLVEAASNEYPYLEEAERSAAGLGATEISNSWVEPERQYRQERQKRGLAPENDGAFNHPGVVVTAAAGDAGYLNWKAPSAEERGFANYPASSPHVVAVGGTRLSLEEGAWEEETVWNGGGATGSGCSELFEAPRWQLGTAAWPSVGCGDKRAVADVSADADPYTGAAIYGSECAGHWCTLGGTSLASPLIAAVFALAGGANGVEYPASTLYANEAGFPAGLHDVVAGSNGKCPGPVSAEDIAGCSIETEAASCLGHAICLAGIGYDGPSGVGTPDGIAAFQPFPEGAGRSATAGGGGSGSQEAARNHSTTSASQNATAGGSPPGSRASSRPGSSAEAATRISGLRLIPHTIAARDGIRPQASRVGFSFTVNVAAPIRATLARRIGATGHRRWKLLPDSLTILARGGHNRGNLRGRNILAPGAYRLTLTPAHGTGQSILITIR